MAEPSSQRLRSFASLGPAKDPVAFVSYAHADAEIALAFRKELATCGLNILMDSDGLKPGEDIAEFARRSVRIADATICVVSKHSLNSAWVVFEAVAALQKEQLDSASRLIACALDQDFYDSAVRLEITAALDKRLAELKQLINLHLVQELDINDLSGELTRLKRMRTELGDVLARLRGSFTLPLARENLLDAAQRVADRIRELRGLQPSRTDPRDIRARAEVVRRNIWDGKTDEALDLALDFVRDFSNDPKHLRAVTMLSYMIRSVAKAEVESKLGLFAGLDQRGSAIEKLLILIDDIEVNPSLPKAG